MKLIAFLVASHATRSHAFVASMKGRTLCSARGLSSSTGTAAPTATESAADLLPPSSVLNRVFETDVRPVILFDGVW